MPGSYVGGCGFISRTRCVVKSLQQATRVSKNIRGLVSTLGQIDRLLVPEQPVYEPVDLLVADQRQRVQALLCFR
jgi:hypothetical protein